MKTILTLLLIVASVTIKAQSLETNSAYPTGYLNTAYFSEGNTIRSIDGVLYMVYDDIPTALLRYPAKKTDKEFEVPSTVMRICSNAFQGTVYLKTLKLHNTVTYGKFTSIVISETAFNDSSIENFIVLEDDEVAAAKPSEGLTDYIRKEYARYDVNGNKVTEDTKGIQIVTYDDNTSEKIKK